MSPTEDVLIQNLKELLPETNWYSIFVSERFMAARLSRQSLYKEHLGGSSRLYSCRSENGVRSLVLYSIS